MALKCTPAVTSRLIKRDPTFHRFTWKGLLQVLCPFLRLMAFSSHFCIFFLQDLGWFLRRFCNVEVVDGDQGLQCEGRCQQWFHLQCGFGLNLSTKQYKRLTDSTEKWIRANCCGESTFPVFNRTDVVYFSSKIYQHQSSLLRSNFTWGYCGHISLGYFVFLPLCTFMWNELIAHQHSNDVVS